MLILWTCLLGLFIIVVFRQYLRRSSSNAPSAASNPDSDKKRKPKLIEVIEKSQENEFENLITQKIDVNAADETNKTALFYSCRSKSPLFLQRLLSCGASPELADDRGDTPLHAACTFGRLDHVKALLDHGVNVNTQNRSGQTPLMMACSNKRPQVVEILLSRGADADLQTNSCETALTFAVGAWAPDVVSLLLKERPKGLYINKDNINGSIPLHISCSGPSFQLPEMVDITKELLAAGANPNAPKRDGCTPLHLAAIHGYHEICSLLIEHGAVVDTQNRFGATALMEASKAGHAEVALVLLKCGANPNACDSDGLQSLHYAARGPNKNHDSSFFDPTPVIQTLISHSADPNARDDGDSTPLHVAAFSGEWGAKAAEVLLRSGADISLENCIGWTPLHCALSESGSKEVARVMQSLAPPSFLSTFDKDRPRVHRSVIPQRKLEFAQKARTEIFGGSAPSAQAIADKIRRGEIKKIVVVTGAGISVSAGIPDFRSPTTGLYSKEWGNKLGMPSPTAAFDLSVFARQPELFYRVAKQVFMPVQQGIYKPTKSHKFIRMLHDKGVLVRNYTQNIDCLEIQAGLPRSALVAAHGSVDTATCMGCGHQVRDTKDLWETVSRDQVPHCNLCNGVLKPDVVFFGESLPKEFFETRTADLSSCDLLIVMGTSLVVYPLAGIVNEVSPTTPRLLINREAVGPFKKSEENAALNYRDTCMLGDCDAEVEAFVQMIGWTDDL